MPDNEQINQGERLKKIRKYLGLNQHDLAPMLRITQSHLSSLEKGKYSITVDLMVLLLAIDRSINLNWLVKGDGEMFIQRQEISIAAEESTPYQVDRLLKVEEFIKEKFPDFKILTPTNGGSQ